MMTFEKYIYRFFDVFTLIACILLCVEEIAAQDDVLKFYTKFKVYVRNRNRNEK